MSITAQSLVGDGRDEDEGGGGWTVPTVLILHGEPGAFEDHGQPQGRRHFADPYPMTSAAAFRIRTMSLNTGS